MTRSESGVRRSRWVVAASLFAMVVSIQGIGAGQAAPPAGANPATGRAGQAETGQGAATTQPQGQGRRGGGAGDPFAGQARIRALVVSGGCCHDYPAQTRILLDAVRRALPVDWTIVYEGGTGTTGRQRVYDTPNWVAGYDLVIHNECFANNNDEAMIRRIVDAHRTVPAVVLHCAMHTYRSAAAADLWREFLGVTSVRHTATHRIAAQLAPDAGPVMEGFKADWVTPIDELYVVDKLWPGAKAIATAVSPEDQRVHPLVWTHHYNGVRVFGTGLGHGNATWEDPVFQDLLVRGVRWATGRVN
jgi:hypothetical protein